MRSPCFKEATVDGLTIASAARWRQAYPFLYGPHIDMATPAVIWNRARAFVRENVLYVDTPADAAALRTFADATTRRIASAMCLASLIATLLWWPFDCLLYAQRPDTLGVMAAWRISTILTTGLGLTLPYLPVAIRKRPVAWFSTGAVVTCWLSTWTCGRVAPLSPEWFGVAIVLPGVSIVFVVPLVERILLALLFGAAAWSGYFLGNPQHLAAERYPGTTISFMLSAVVATVAIGHLSYHYLRQSFFTERQLAAVKDELEDRVRAQTSDLRQFTGRLERLRERERREIAADLEAGPGEELSALRFEADLLEERAARRGLMLPMEQVRALVGQMGETFGRRLGALRPRTLEAGLVHAVRQLADEQRHTTGLDVVLHAELDQLPVSGEAATATYRIVQEALTNVAKHSGARHVGIELRQEGSSFVATVRDDGCGLSERSQWRPESIGIIGMQERALMIGGQLSVARNPSGGTLVTLRAPLTGVSA